jgi:hypothetical protein
MPEYKVVEGFSEVLRHRNCSQAIERGVEMVWTKWNV